ncbi:hypothetical protein GCM10028857_26020 [Salinarchaeum chitinilyticum]
MLVAWTPTRVGVRGDQMTTVSRARRDLLAAPKAAAGMHFAGGYAGAVERAGGATPNGDALAALSGSIAPISWPTHFRSRNLVALVVTPAA